MELLNATSAVSTIVTGTTGYLAEFMPIFALAVGLALAFAVIGGLMSVFFGKTLQENDEGVK